MSARAWLHRRYKHHGTLLIVDRETGEEIPHDRMDNATWYDGVWVPTSKLTRARAARLARITRRTRRESTLDLDAFVMAAARREAKRWKGALDILAERDALGPGIGPL